MGRPAPDKAGNARTRRAIVHLLKQQGPMDAQQLAGHLRLSPMAVRLHLYALQAEQLVRYEDQPRPRGRPAKLWQLTPAADHLFPEGYAELTLSLLASISETFGKAGLDRVLALRTRDQIAVYRKRMSGAGSLARRLKALAASRTDEGYMADVRREPGGAFLLVENHCPICAAAAACTGLCAKELEVFQTVLGDGVTVTRTEHIVAGARRCAYRVAPRLT
jgi:predicted ArsR family transcriptional regulator